MNNEANNEMLTRDAYYVESSLDVISQTMAASRLVTVLPVDGNGTASLKSNDGAQWVSKDTTSRYSGKYT